VTASHITGNRTSVDSNGEATASGGGLMVGRLTLTGSTVSSNTITVHAGPDAASAVGGAIYAAGSDPLTIGTSTIAGNHVDATSAANDATGNGAVIGPSGTFTMRASTVSGNTAHSDAPGGTAIAHAGGVQLNGASAHALIQNSTIAFNQATSTGSSAFAGGGGLESSGVQTVTITNATVANNHSSERGGGLEAAGVTTTTLEATILAGNTAPDGPDCKGNVASAGHNLLGNDTNCTFASQSSDKVNKPAKLGPLHANGGPTQTMAVLTGSPALNAIPKAACALPTDQRGIKRPQGPACEIGAFELQP
jgi:hypothetical protein